MNDGDPLMDQMIQAVELDLHQIVGQLEPAPLQEMVSHHFGWLDGRGSGKRIRPLMCLLTCAAAGGEWELAVPAASSVELIHNFSLIHDDIQDQSELRRHRQTVWKVWGQAQAINTGDALFALARLSSNRLSQRGVEPARVLAVQQWIDEACLELTKGQHLDLAFDAGASGRLERYLRMIRAKTSSLLAASAAAGASIAGAPEPQVAAYQQFGLHLGQAFQLLDDLLGTWGEPDETGKSAADDLISRKPTYPSLYGLRHSAEFAALWSRADADLTSMVQLLEAAGARQAAQAAATDHTQLALQHLAAAGPLEPAGAALRGLADRLLERQT